MNSKHMQQNSPTSTPQHVPFWRLTTFLLAAFLAGSVVLNFLAAQRSKQTQEELANVQASLQQSQERASSLHAELDGYFAKIIVNLEQQFIPLDRSARMTLRAGQEISERIARETEDPLRRASAYCTLGHIRFHQQDLRAAAAAYQKAFESANFPSEQQTNQIRAYAANHLVVALAQLGHEETSLQICDQICQQVQTEQNDTGQTSWEMLDELSFARRNQAVLLASTEAVTRAVESAKLHLDILEQLRRSAPDDVQLMERLMDAKYLLAGLLWRKADDTSQTEAVALLEAVYESALALQTSAESRMRKGESVDYGLYKSASDRAKRELELAREFLTTAHGQPRRNPAFWTRKNLFRGRRSIGTEILLDQLRMPGEFENQAAILVKWSGRAWLDTPNVAFIKELVSQVKIWLLVEDYESEEEARLAFRQADIDDTTIRFLQCPSNTPWVRDFGPITVLGSDDLPIWIDYQHLLPETRSNNDLLVERLGRLTGHRVIRCPLLLEGGNLIGNGAGFMACTTQLERDNLALGYSPEQFRKQLRHMMGCRDLIVLDELVGEPTGHVDWFLTFVSPDTAVIGQYDPAVDSRNAAILDANAASLRRVRVGPSGVPLNVVRIPMPPHPSTGFGGSYTNVVYANGKLLVPQYENAGAELNAVAIRIYQELLPDWQVVPINCSDMLPNAGALHCATANIARLPLPLP